ncbi:hypothetical protein [uncultured Traorella sp.]|jgi:hypothetical protein|uniref:hypothetical protein n=1 Tax=uncultured Traorella sp. TaxID=1929048 RepID=UPI0025E6517D|nr:hypothetical protein [uncultured Traorella sp.]
MKKLAAVVALCLLAGCSSKETIEVDYVHPNHNEIAEQVLGEPLGKDETQEIFESTESVDVYYEVVDDTQVTLSIFNNMDYYYTGTVDLDACEFQLSVTGLAPYSYASKTVECPNFAEDSEFTFTGTLYNRNDENAYTTPFEAYYYEDDDTLYDYTLDLSLEEINEDELKKLANYLYTENILSNYAGEMWVRVYPKTAYDEAYGMNTDEAWNKLDSESFVATIWVDAENDIAEIYDGQTSELIERINYR